MPIIWQPAMSVGNKIIDDEHKYLFALVNCVELAFKAGELQSIRLFLGQLVDYCKEHFSHEEQLQLKIRYPYYVDHKREHIEIIEQLEELRARFTEPTKPAQSNESTASAALDEIEDYQPEQGDAPPPPEGLEVPPPATEPPVIDDALIKEVTGLMRHWVLDHVLVVDRKMQPFFAKLKLKK